MEQARVYFCTIPSMFQSIVKKKNCPPRQHCAKIAHALITSAHELSIKIFNMIYNSIVLLLFLQDKPPTLDWFPRLWCMSLDAEDGPTEDRMR